MECFLVFKIFCELYPETKCFKERSDRETYCGVTTLSFKFSEIFHYFYHFHLIFENVFKCYSDYCFFATSNSKTSSEILLIDNSQKLKSPQDLLQEVSQRLKRWYSFITIRNVGKTDPPPRQADTSPDRHPLSKDGHCSERYASYWNAFLFCFNISSTFPHSEFPAFARKCQISQVGKPYFIVPDFSFSSVRKNTNWSPY